jgi:hypothetical protein
MVISSHPLSPCKLAFNVEIGCDSYQ